MKPSGTKQYRDVRRRVAARTAWHCLVFGACTLTVLGLGPLATLDASSRLSALPDTLTTPLPTTHASAHEVRLLTREKHEVRMRYTMAWRITDAQAFRRAFRTDTPSATGRIEQSMDAMLRDKAGSLGLGNLRDLAGRDTPFGMLHELNMRCSELGLEVRAWHILEVAPRTNKGQWR